MTEQLKKYTSETQEKIKRILEEYQQNTELFIEEINLIQCPSPVNPSLPLLISVELRVKLNP